MSQNSFIKQYLAKQQELLRQRLEREAREATEADGKRTHTNIYIHTGYNTDLTTPSVRAFSTYSDS